MESCLALPACRMPQHNPGGRDPSRQVTKQLADSENREGGRARLRLQVSALGHVGRMSGQRCLWLLRLGSKNASLGNRTHLMPGSGIRSREMLEPEEPSGSHAASFYRRGT